jgi:hypothetical protein
MAPGPGVGRGLRGCDSVVGPSDSPYLPSSASWTLPTIFAPGLTSVLSPSSYHFEGQTSLVLRFM